MIEIDPLSTAYRVSTPQSEIERHQRLPGVPREPRARVRCVCMCSRVRVVLYYTFLYYLTPRVDSTDLFILSALSSAAVSGQGADPRSAGTTFSA